MQLVNILSIQCNIKQKYKPFQYLGRYGPTLNECLVFLNIHIQEGLQIFQVCYYDMSTVEN